MLCYTYIAWFCYRFSDFGHPWDTPRTVIGDKRDAGAPCRLGVPVFRVLRTRSSFHVGKSQLSVCWKFCQKQCNFYYLPSVIEVPLVNSFTLPCVIIYKERTCSAF